MFDLKPRDRGVPSWVVTFADLMTLLMCFYVLLLSFSEMDVAKFKELSGSMRNAFGVQAEIKARVMPAGTSVFTREFSPAEPEPTPMNTIRQFTVNGNLNALETRRRILELEERAEREAERLREALAEEIREGTLVVRREGIAVVIQILEKDSFASGRSEVDPAFLPTLARVGRSLAPIRGAITVSGHTDDVPIATSRYRSNWDLSAARAASVAHELLAAGIAPDRIMVSGHADTQPRVPNDTPENRALNRRIDISLITSRERHGGWLATDPSVESGTVPGEASGAPAAPAGASSNGL